MSCLLHALCTINFEHLHQMRLKPILSTRIPMNGKATAGMMYTKLFTKLASEKLNPYFDIRNTLDQSKILQ